MNATLICPRCGEPIAPGTHFCTECGADVSSEQAIVTTADVRTEPRLSDRAEAEMLGILQQATLGEYDIVGELGRGGMAIVYLAHDIALDRKVAIKLMAPTLLSVEGMADRFKREAKTSAQLSHPHIIPIYSVRQTERLLCFIMKYVEGRALDSIIDEEGALPIRMVRAILAHVGSALGYAHRNGVIHRDIKPANIMIDEEGFAVVTDFGIAKPANADELTAAGTLLGTPRYMSPEQCSGKSLTPASDQYSLGAVAYEMLTGTQPFAAEGLMEIMRKHFFEIPTPIEELRPDCPTPFASAVTRMLAKEPQERWPTVEAAMTAAGAESLRADDPVRSRMVKLARSSKRRLHLSHISTPRSPMPQVSEEVLAMSDSSPATAVEADSAIHPNQAPPATPVRQRRRFPAAALLLAALFLTAAGWIGYKYVLPAVREQEPTAATPSEDTAEPAVTTDSLPIQPGAGEPSQPEATTTTEADPTTAATLPEPEPTQPQPPQTGTVTIDGLPAEGTVFVDDQRSEGGELALRPGRHTLRLEAPGYESDVETVTVRAGATFTVRFDGRLLPTPTPEVPPIQPPQAPDTAFVAFTVTNTRVTVLVSGEPVLDNARRGTIAVEANLEINIRFERDGFVPFDTMVVIAPKDTLDLRRLTLVRRGS